MVKFLIEIPTEECFQRSIKAAEKYIAAYDDLEKHNVGIDVVIQAVRSDNANSMSSKRKLPPHYSICILQIWSRIVENTIKRLSSV